MLFAYVDGNGNGDGDGDGNGDDDGNAGGLAELFTPLLLPNAMKHRCLIQPCLNIKLIKCDCFV